MKVASLQFNPICENTYVVWDDTNECIVVDAGNSDERENARLKEFIDSRGLHPRMAVNTHGHFDHIGAVSALMDADTPLYIHALDAPLLTDPKLNLCRMIGQTITAPPANRLLQEGDLVQAAGITLTVLHTPGHTPGSVCYRVGDVLFTGDTLFHLGCGRTDFPGGSEADMRRSLARLAPLARECTIYPGH